MSFAERLKAIRERAGMSLYELAKRTGINRQSLWQLEGGNPDKPAQPSWETIQRIVAVSELKISYTDLEDPNLKLPEYTPGQRGRPSKKRKGK